MVSYRSYLIAIFVYGSFYEKGVQIVIVSDAVRKYLFYS